MIKKFGITIGGLQQKILNLVLVFIIVISGVYLAVSVYQSRVLSATVGEANEEQHQSIEQVSDATMEAVVASSLTRQAAMEAYIANDMFAEVESNVLTLQSFATGLYNNADNFDSHPVSYPDPSMDGTPTAQLQHAEGVDPDNSETLGLIGNMSDVMLAMFKSCDKLDSCFIGTADGLILYVDDRSGSYVDENGEIIKIFDVTHRPWYTGAVEKGDVYFTGIELDTSTGIAGLVCSAPVYKDGELVAVVGADIFLTSIDEYVSRSDEQGAFVCVINDEGKVIFSPKNEGTFSALISSEAKDLRNSENSELAAFVTKSLSEQTGLETITVDGEEYYLTGAPMGTVGWAIVNAVEKQLTRQPTEMMLAQYKDINERSTEKFESGVGKSKQTVFVMTFVILVLATSSALFVANRIVKPVERMTTRMAELSGNDLAFEMEDAYKTGDEIQVLAESFAKLSKRTVMYIEQITKITAEKERIGAELELATRIQAHMLPNIFPAFPERAEFDIFASMSPAKEVGGDFYDFFLIDDDHLGMVMADVSGKGVPAALFMMMSKILVNNFAMMGGSPAKVLEQTNTQICKNNEEEMFVTVWFGVMEISTGKITAANAGHEYPIIKKANGKFELFKDKHGFVVGGMEGMRYKEYEFTLERGGTLFLYTDGVAEATNAKNELFGTERMLEALNSEPEAAPKTLLSNMEKAVDGFVGEAPQFDDLTMLSVKLL
ncbi:SpoIIE family protein phosphatase [uncultured Ruminococcus sp.]|uniref:SpoIIE family protein phosphatase n=1 Tax=uncultured Ruminococcus sp. TaxID=165186 RepID=UPI0025F1765B|nr:SpoIIE family protein phosphatase [uncultured Ruminococcus sp.]